MEALAETTKKEDLLYCIIKQIPPFSRRMTYLYHQRVVLCIEVGDLLPDRRNDRVDDLSEHSLACGSAVVSHPITKGWVVDLTLIRLLTSCQGLL